MKKLIFISHLLLILFSCGLISNKNDDIKKERLGEFELLIDTIIIDVKPYSVPNTEISLTHAIKYGEKYYCYINENGTMKYYKDIRHFFIISESGLIEHHVELPNPIHNCIYLDLFLYNDTIYTKPYMSNKTYFLDLKKIQWIETDEVNDIIYEDDKFYVTFLDFGEWGYTTWFKDKYTGKEYEIESASNIINRIDSLYFITSGLRVLCIENPLEMKECKNEYYYEVVAKKDFAEGTTSLQGTEVVFEDTTYSYWDYKEPKLYIATSFVADSDLFHLCIDSTKTFIAKLVNGKIVPLYTLGKKYSIYDWYYSYRCRIKENNSQLLKFSEDDPDMSGLIEIDDKEIRIRYFKFKKLKDTAPSI